MRRFGAVKVKRLNKRVSPIWNLGGCGGGVHLQLNPGAEIMPSEVTKIVSAPAEYQQGTE